MTHFIERNFSYPRAHNNIAIIEDASKLGRLHGDRKDGMERRFLSTLVDADHFLKPDYTLVGDNVIIVLPVEHIPERPESNRDQ